MTLIKICSGKGRFSQSGGSFFQNILWHVGPNHGGSSNVTKYLVPPLFQTCRRPWKYKTKSRYLYHQMTMISQLIEKKTPMFLVFSMFLQFTEAATSICLLKKVFTTRRQKTLELFQWFWLLIIINFIIEQLYAEHRFFKYTYAWLLLTPKLYSEFHSCSVTIKFACCRRDFPSCFSHGL